MDAHPSKRPNKDSVNGTSTPLLLLPTLNRSMSYKEQQIFSPTSNTFFPYGQPKVRAIKMIIFSVLEDPTSFLGRMYHWIVILLIVLSLVLAMIMTISHSMSVSPHRIFYYLTILEFILAVIFITEYILRVWSCSIKGHYKGTMGIVKFMLKPHMVLDLVAIMASLALSFLTANYDLGGEKLRYAMPLQLIRILRLDRQRGAFETFHAVIKNHFKELLTCWYMGFIVILFLSYLAYAEPVVIGSRSRTVDSLANSLYWAIVSMTTIGYGDIIPRTVTSKILLCIFGVAGAGFIALPAGIIGSGFALQVIEQKKKQHNRKRRRPAAMLIQAAWKVWASDLTRNFMATWMPHTKIVKSFSDSELQGLFSSPQDKLINLPGTSLRYESATSQAQLEVTVEGRTDGAYIVYQELTKGQKIAIGFIRHLKFIVALKYFRRTRKPYDEKDIMDQFSGGQVEIYGHLRLIEKQIDVIVDKRDTMQEEIVKVQSEMNKISERQDEILETVKRMAALLECLEKNGTESTS